MAKKSNIVKSLDSLTKKSEPVASVEEATGILSKLEEALRGLENGLGLAAVQIGIPKQVGIMTNKNGDKMPLINPEIIKTEEEFVFVNEGCLSFPNIQFNTNRYRHVTIKNHVIDGDDLREETQYYYYEHGENSSDDLLCIQVQHEIDHFNGIVFRERQSLGISKPIVNVEAKIGRNDPCPCGSNKKYKKCCLTKHI